MHYLIRFIQAHELFRQAEIDALAELCGLQIQWLEYSNACPFAIIRFHGVEDLHAAAEALIVRSILSLGIYELWGYGTDYPTLHTDVKRRSHHVWDQYRLSSFRFELDSFQGRRSPSDKRDTIESFSYMALEGPIVMKTPDCIFTIFEDFKLRAKVPKRLFLGRLVAESGRKVIGKYDLKKRRYLSTTSMDAELSLVTANLALAAPGKFAYDPFMGTGSFPLSCAQFGCTVFGSDLDGRSIRGKNGRNVQSNFDQYNTTHLYMDGFAADVTNTPVRDFRFLDIIVCDPPYGVREGLKVLGSIKPALQHEILRADGKPAHTQDGYIPPRRPYSFIRMLDDILDLSSRTLVDSGRLCLWMPVAGTAEHDDALDAQSTPIVATEIQQDYAIPQHPALELVNTCTQHFNKWSRRLLTYRRLEDSAIDAMRLGEYRARRHVPRESPADMQRSTADELNSFRRRYFQGFKDNI